MNTNNFMGDRSSTRVRAPPGGASSICFGASEPAAAAPVRRAAPRAAAAAAAPRAAPASSKREEPTPKSVLQDSNARSGSAAPAAAAKAVATSGTHVSSNAYATGSNQNCGNVITDRSSTRLHAPPGGKSSFSLGWN